MIQLKPKLRYKKAEKLKKRHPKRVSFFVNCSKINVLTDTRMEADINLTSSGVIYQVLQVFNAEYFR